MIRAEIYCFLPTPNNLMTVHSVKRFIRPMLGLFAVFAQNNLRHLWALR